MRISDFKKHWVAARELLASSLPHLKGLLWQHRRRLLLGLVLLALARAASLVIPVSTKYVIDEVILGGRTALLPWILAAVGAAALAQAVLGYGVTRMVGLMGLDTMTGTRRRLMSRVVRLPVPFFDRGRSGELASRIYFDAERSSRLVGVGLLRFVSSLLTGLLTAAVLLYLEWRLASLVGGLLLLLLVVQVWGFLRLGPLHLEVGQINVRAHGRLSEMLGGVRTVKAYTAEGREEQRFARDTFDELRRSRTILTLNAMLNAVSSVALGLVAIAVILVGVGFVEQGSMTLGDLVMFVALLAVVVTPLNEAAGMASEMSRALASLERVARLEEQETEVEGDRDREPVKEVSGEIVFDRVSYSYDGRHPVLGELSFVAPAGSTTALVGPSGAGKSTIFRLLLGFDDPTAGRVLVDGRDLRTLRRTDHRRFLGVVLQDDFVFDGSILDNILYGAPEATREKACRAGQLAHCEEFVARFEKGWDTVIGERGVRLSVGQRQRVAIARALLADPRILLLDEATSNLDSLSERCIRDALAMLRRDRTTIVIAHRLSTVRDADQILFLDRGRLVEKGLHEELLETGEHYRKVWEMQSGEART